jgi:hypothetical protein
VNPDFVFSRGDLPALTELLQKALSHPIELARRGQDALRRMQSWSAWENVSGVLEVVKQALSRTRAKRAFLKIRDSHAFFRAHTLFSNAKINPA